MFSIDFARLIGYRLDMLLKRYLPRTIIKIVVASLAILWSWYSRRNHTYQPPSDVHLLVVPPLHSHMWRDDWLILQEQINLLTQRHTPTHSVWVIFLHDTPRVTLPPTRDSVWAQEALLVSVPPQSPRLDAREIQFAREQYFRQFSTYMPWLLVPSTVLDARNHDILPDTDHRLRGVLCVPTDFPCPQHLRWSELHYQIVHPESTLSALPITDDTLGRWRYGLLLASVLLLL